MLRRKPASKRFDRRKPDQKSVYEAGIGGIAHGADIAIRKFGTLLNAEDALVRRRDGLA